MREIKTMVYSIEELEESAKRKALDEIRETLNDDFWNFRFPEDLQMAQEFFWKDYGFAFDTNQIELNIEHRFCKDSGVDKSDIDLLRLCKAANINEKAIDALKKYSENFEEPTIETSRASIYVYFDDENDELPEEVHLMTDKLSSLLGRFMREKLDELASKECDMWYDTISDEACIEYANDHQMEFYGNGEQFID